MDAVTPRVALISDWYLPRFGGMELYLRDLAAHLQAARVQVDVLTPVPGPDRVDAVRVYRLCDPTRPNGGYWFPPPPQASSLGDLFYFLELFLPHGGSSVLQRLRAQLDRERYDLAHIHFANAPFAYAATNLALELGMPVLATFHSVLGHIQVPVAAAFARMMGAAAWPGKVGLTAVSRTVAHTLAPVTGAAHIEILPNAVDATLWDGVRQRRGPAGRSRPSGRIELVSVMRLHGRKRPAALIDAMAALISRLRSASKARLRIAGDGPLRNALERRIVREGLQDHIELCGRLDGDGIANLLADADCFLLPSRLESFGLAALEARLSGVPVLAMQDAGVREFLTHDGDSLLVDSDQAFRSALIEIVDNAALRRRLTEACGRPLDMYSWAAIIERHLRAYREVIERTRRKPPASALGT